MVALLRRSLNEGVTNQYIVDVLAYIRTHLYPLVNALEIGTNYDAVTSIITNLARGRRPPANSTTRSRLRRAHNQLRNGILPTTLGNIRDTIGSLRGRPNAENIGLLDLANVMYKAMGAILVMTYTAICQFGDVSTEENRKSFAIVLIGSFVEGGYLGEEFSWARFFE
jgi:hypothetical protein